ncbi:transcription factor Sp2 [Colossoma macropomum]|uniref:transcription factor Sp2 n=1 Tax=Colossoma macropomum TaxID=42526 RepID=UPI001864C47E|nr:transcription factor Sp2 [Colossoma macropomum]XP_036451358.1 transcription factor Sp2 [Colossoma macropomum]XP_036451366.1 transcription factor Sp2 [Colossoma macropomum]XP_036451374.1 transcription factor Sp2 [Colossoma macropomum]
MEFESEDQILQNIPSVSGVSQQHDEVSTDNRESDGKKRSPRHSVSDKNPVQSNQAVTNGVTTPETKTDTVQTVLPLTPNIMPAEVNEPITKVIHLNSNLVSSDLLVMKVQRQSPHSVCSKEFDEGLSHVTKEEVKIQDFANIVDSDDITHGRSKNCEALEKTRDCPKKERPECSQDCDQAACKTQIIFYERQEGFDAAIPEAMTCAKDIPVQEKALDLSLPKKKARDNKEKCKWVLDSGYEGSLLMEVDEIEDDTQHVEVDEDDEECWFTLRNDDPNNFLLENWDQHSVSHIAIPSPPCTSFSSLDPKDTLLIDDQGIPYTLTPDGQKVPQIDPSKMPKVPSEEISTGFAQIEDEATASSQDSDTAQELSLPGTCLDLSIETQQDTVRTEKKSPLDSTDEAKSAALPTISSLPSLPIQIVASNTGSNTPILLLPQSQLQTLSSSATKTNPGVMALTLPLALAQNTQSSPVFLLLSSPQVSGGIQSSTLSEQLSQISSTLPVALPTLGLKPEPVSCTTNTDVSGQNKPCNSSSAPTSPTASSSTSSATSRSPAKQMKTEACSDTPTSFQEALLRLAVSAVQKAEKQPKSSETPSVVTPSTEATQSASPSATHAPEEQVLSPVSEPASIPADQTDSLLSSTSADGLPSLSSTSPLRPSSPIFPTNHPKNQDSQALGPRRILYCQYCPRVFYYLSDLERHSITHSQSKPHVCQLCGKAFKRSSHLERHKHIHTGQRNFVCQLCPRRFREAAELTRHQRVHTGEKPFQCLLCHMRFAERNTLRRHTKRKHQGQQQEAMSMKVKPETEAVSLIGIQGQQEENAEWYSSTMTEMDSDNDTGGE